MKNGDHLIRCLAYIDLNMVRAGVVQHPDEWVHGGYHEIQNPKQRYSLVNRQKLTELLGIKDNDLLPQRPAQTLLRRSHPMDIPRPPLWFGGLG